VRLDVLQQGVVSSSVSIALKGLPRFRLETFESAGLPITETTKDFRGRWLSSRVGQ
jgi:hypothetical protein